MTLYGGYNAGTWAQLRFASDGTAYAIFYTGYYSSLIYLKRPPGGSWSITSAQRIIQYEMGLDIGPDDVPRIITASNSNGHLLFAEDLGSGLVFQDLTSLLGRRAAFGKDIAVDSIGRVHISFTTYDPSTPGDYELWYGVRDSGTWSFEPVDTDFGAVGYRNRIDTAPDGTPYISYYHDPEQALKLAHKTTTGWFVETVTSVRWSPPTYRLPSQDLHIDPSGIIYLLYWDSIARCVTLASSTRFSYLAISNLVEDIQEIIDSNPDTPLADKLEDVVAEAQDALEELDKTPPDNQAALRNIEEAVGDLDRWVVEGGLLDVHQGTQLMDSFTAIARQIAMDTLQYAIESGGDPDLIEEAQQALAEGDDLRLAESFKDAVDKYKDALANAESAIP
ncbi:MAG: hypothetical protein ACXAEU_12870 [Candidatus Hodarchaeales archaeon]